MGTTQKATNAKYSKTELLWFSHLLLTTLGHETG